MIEKNTTSLFDKEKPAFTTIPNETIDNIKNSNALGIYCYLSAKPSGWIICTKQLMNHFNRGRDSIDKDLKYLREIGVLKVNTLRNNAGRFIKRDTILCRGQPNK